MTDFLNMIPKGDFFKGKEFEQPQTVKFVKAEKVKANDPRFGDAEGNTVEWTFEQEGKERKFSNNSARLLTAFHTAQVTEGDVVLVERSGTGVDTQWKVSKLGTDAGEVNVADIPF